MKKVTFTEYRNMKYLNGVYILTEKDGCTLCKRYIESLENDYNVDDWTVIELKPYELDPVRKEYNLRGFPVTTFYVNNEVVWEKTGALFSVQMRSLNKTIREHTNNECIKFYQHGQVPNFPFKLAVKKPIPVRCFKMDKNFQVETLEGVMKGKPGDWLMVGIDGEMYPCDGEIFEKTYDIQDYEE